MFLLPATVSQCQGTRKRHKQAQINSAQSRKQARAAYHVFQLSTDALCVARSRNPDTSTAAIILGPSRYKENTQTNMGQLKFTRRTRTGKNNASTNQSVAAQNERSDAIFCCCVVAVASLFADEDNNDDKHAGAN